MTYYRICLVFRLFLSINYFWSILINFAVAVSYFLPFLPPSFLSVTVALLYTTLLPSELRTALLLELV